MWVEGRREEEVSGRLSLRAAQSVGLAGEGGQGAARGCSAAGRALVSGFDTRGIQRARDAAPAASSFELRHPVSAEL